MSEDEFDSIPDQFSNIHGIDWETLLSQNGPAPRASASNGISTAVSQSREHSELQDDPRGSPFPQPESSSSAYFSDDNNMDSAFLAELDRVEQQALLGAPCSNAAPYTVGAQTLVMDGGAESASTTRLPDVEDIRTFRHIQRTGVVETNRGCGPSANVPLELSCPHQSPIQISSSSSGKAKASEIQDILSAYEDELTCPICRDLLVAAHIANPCGHTFCGECGWQWHVEKRNNGCPCCRQAFDRSVPMIPNIAIDNTVEKHVNALAISGATEWESEGRRYMEWITRMKSWRRGAHKRERRKRPKTSIPIEIFDPPDDWLDPLQDSDVELIPRPIRRARRHQQVFIQSGFELV